MFTMNKFIDIKQQCDFTILQFEIYMHARFSNAKMRINTNMKLMNLHMFKMHMLKSLPAILRHANSLNKQRMEK